MFTGTILNGHWALGIGHWALGIGHWALGIGHYSVSSASPTTLLPYSPTPLLPLLPYATKPERKALTAAWVRSSAHSLFRILRTWVFTVPTVI